MLCHTHFPLVHMFPMMSSGLVLSASTSAVGPIRPLLFEFNMGSVEKKKKSSFISD